MDKNCDFKILSLQLYGKEVEIILVKDSPTALLYKSTLIKGILTGRTWGDALIEGRKGENVVALTIQTADKESEIPCADILDLKRA